MIKEKFDLEEENNFEYHLTETEIKEQLKEKKNRNDRNPRAAKRKTKRNPRKQKNNIKKNSRIQKTKQ